MAATSGFEMVTLQPHQKSHDAIMAIDPFLWYRSPPAQENKIREHLQVIQLMRDGAYFAFKMIEQYSSGLKVWKNERLHERVASRPCMTGCKVFTVECDVNPQERSLALHGVSEVTGDTLWSLRYNAQDIILGSHLYAEVWYYMVFKAQMSPHASVALLCSNDRKVLNKNSHVVKPVKKTPKRVPRRVTGKTPVAFLPALAIFRCRQ